MDLSEEALRKMAQMDIIDVNPKNLTDISKIEIDESRSVSERVDAYIREVGNPFLVRVGEYAVKIGYSDSGGTLEERMEQYVKKIARIKY